MCDSILSTYPTQEQIKSILHYDPETGIFTWLENKSLSGRFFKNHQKRFAGKRAGSKASSGNKTYIRLNSALCKSPMHAHRVAFIYMLGFAPENVDHINGDGCDNRWSNLRWSDRSDNAKNVRKSTANTSGVTGVGWNKGQGCWRAYIKINRKMISLGNHRSFEDAVKARKKAESEFNFRSGHGSDRPIY